MQKKNNFYNYIHTKIESVVYNEKNANWNSGRSY